MITQRLSTALTNRYRIEKHIGQGGMATVYLAHDLKHDRKVALKVLRPELAAVIGAERFLQEIKVTANLQHPHILPLHDSGDADGFLFYVMPFVEGESLREKLNREKQFAVDDAIEITRSVAAALDYAHRQGVIHRDIKPENILIHDGQALVADFGIALAVSQAGGTRLTETGLSIGTPHYMSPEQAMGDRELDARSDVYSLGAMLYEMLAGDPPYTGSTAQAIVAKVITEKAPPVTAARDTVPGHIAAAIQKALSKLPADRFHTAAEFADALVNPGFTLPATMQAVGVEGSDVRGAARGRLTWAAAVILLGGLAAWGWLKPGPAPRVARFTLALPQGQQMRNAIGTGLDVSPDGSEFVYVGVGENSPWMLYRRRMDQLVATSIIGTDAGFAPFYSPDGKSVGFLTIGSQIRVVGLDGGPPVTLTDSILQSGADWGQDGMIYFSHSTTRGIARISASGGAIESVTEREEGEQEHRWVQSLPGGKGAIFTIWRTGVEDADIAAVSFATGEKKILVRGTYGRYAASGHLLYTRADGSLFAIPFDPEKLEVRGSSTPLLQHVIVKGGGAAEFTISRAGHLLYRTGESAGTEEMVWVSRSGAESPVPLDADDYDVPRLSPDNTRLAVTVGAAGGAGGDIWVFRFDPPTRSRLTFEASNNYPVWSRDGSRILFSSDRGRRRALHSKVADGSADAESLYQSGLLPWEGLFSPDSKWLVIRDNDGTDRSIYYRAVDGDTTLQPFGIKSFQEVSPDFSPDGKWMVYASNESGSNEVYVRPFPGPGGKWQISSGGGTEPAWSHSGREIFYRSDEELISVRVRTNPTFSIEQRTALFDAGSYDVNPNHRSYDVSADDERFLFVKSGSQTSDLVVALNWLDDFKRTVAK